jgi:hypothetical protein
MEWLGLKEKFKSKDGGSHTIYFTGTSSKATLMVASDPTPVEKYLESKKATDSNANAAYNHYTSIVKVKENDVETKEKTYKSLGSDKKDQKRAARYAHQVAVQELRNIMKDFADKLSLVTFDADNANLNVKTVVNKTSSGSRASNVTAWPLTYLPGNEVGSAPVSDPPGWKKYAQDSSEQWVRGHLLSEHLHGPGKAWNLVPVIQSVNSSMAAVEAKVIPLAKQQGKLYYYSTSVTYDDSRTTADEKAIPTGVTITWGELNKAGTPGDSKDKKTTVSAGPFTQNLPNFGGPPNLNEIGVDTMINKGIKESLARDINVCKNKFTETHGGFSDIGDLIDKMEKFYQDKLTKKAGVDFPKRVGLNSSLTPAHKALLIQVITVEKRIEIK